MYRTVRIESARQSKCRTDRIETDKQMYRTVRIESARQSKCIGQLE